MTRSPVPSDAGPRAALWLLAVAVVSIGANLLALVSQRATRAVMGGVSAFAQQVSAHDQAILRYFNPAVFALVTIIVVAYLRPTVHYLLRRWPAPAPDVVCRRVIGLPLMVAVSGFLPWLIACVVFPGVAIIRFGHWPVELLSQQVFSPLVAGFLAATIIYFFLDWLVRRRIAPVVFPDGQLAEVTGRFALGVRARLFVFVVAVAFTPLFTMLGLVRATVTHVTDGVPVGEALLLLDRASRTTFVLYVLLGVILTVMVARGFTFPLVAMAGALRRVREGDLDSGVTVESGDELGVLGDGVNALVQTLRDRDHILNTFGRVVEPSVRDQLLAGDLRLGGELRTASVLFCDLRGFTTLAEQQPPVEVVQTLNRFFGLAAHCVREHDGYVDKFIGDAMLAVFGLFDDAAEVAAGAPAAVRCALGIRHQLAALNRERHAAGHLPLAVAVTIHTGELLAGRIGAEHRHEYTVIGDTVNVAARLQEHCKERGYDVLLSDTTCDHARRAGLSLPIATRDVVTLRGRHEPVAVSSVA